MMAAARIRRLKVDPAMRTVDVGVSSSGSGTRHSVPITLAYSCKLVRLSRATVAHFQSPNSKNRMQRRAKAGLFTQANLRNVSPQARFLACARLSHGQTLRNWPLTSHAQRTFR